jgi:multicomponent Na+:H+ antiporter subunit E
VSKTESISAYILIFLSSLLLWILLTGSLAAEELIAGLLVALVVSIVSASHVSIFSGLKIHPFAPFSLVNYLVYFLYALVHANFDLARKVLSPSLPINPGMVEFHTTLQSELGRMLLANSITLTPGTLTVDLVGDRLLVHWISIPEDVDMTDAIHLIADGFEKRISGFLK